MMWVNWQFLRNILQTMGLSPHLQQLLMHCITSSRLAVLWNGEKLESFSPSRGLRQGDPIAPYLFVLCMEALSQKINEAVHNGLWKPVKVSSNGPLISHIFFADDLLLFGEASDRQAKVIEDVLQDFCKCSGQKISVAKSVFCTSANVGHITVGGIAQKLQMAHTTDLGKYLGVPMLHGRVRVSHFTYLVDKMDRKLTSWKVKTLSKAGRRILIQSSLATQPYYAMQTTLLPMTILNGMDKICRRFFWGDGEEGRKMHTISWEKLCKPKAEGGLGLKRLYEMNIALLGKLVWDLLNQKDTLWVKVISAKYKYITGEIKAGSSYTWKGISKAFAQLKAGYDLSQQQIIWKEEAKEKYRVASGYRFLMYDANNTEVDNIWNKIWELKGPTRGCFMIWTLAHKALITNAFLNSRHVQDEATCTICGDIEETALHALRDCPWAKEIWETSVPNDQKQLFFEVTDERTWIADNLEVSRGNNQWKYFWKEAIYGIWWWRNKVTHGNQVERPPAYAFISTIVDRARNLRLAWGIE